ncbi:hypothetical protein MMC11_006485 [Xylographa trunciseda]|nr:hypothetical protein [Xylographa trunciseda]
MPRWEGTDRVARGLEETCGRDRNSSRSIVPELSYRTLHEPLPQSIDLILIDYPPSAWLADALGEEQGQNADWDTQFDPETIFSIVWALEPPVRLRASYSAAGFADATIAERRISQDERWLYFYMAPQRDRWNGNYKSAGDKTVRQ